MNVTWKKPVLKRLTTVNVKLAEIAMDNSNLYADLTRKLTSTLVTLIAMVLM